MSRPSGSHCFCNFMPVFINGLFRHILFLNIDPSINYCHYIPFEYELIYLIDHMKVDLIYMDIIRYVWEYEKLKKKTKKKREDVWGLHMALCMGPQWPDGYFLNIAVLVCPLSLSHLIFLCTLISPITHNNILLYLRLPFSPY